ncbi:MAG TPA: hypothetical protein VN151_13740 [Terracidiphilus sp.]|nr:hypothetical protein [Terracidiphilus sp.]
MWTPGAPDARKFTAIWQSEQYFERHFIKKIFDPYISEHIVDCKHEAVLDNAILIDAFIYSNNADYYASFRGKNAFLVHLGDEFYELGVDRYIHFRGVFRTIWSSVFNPHHVMVIPLGYSARNDTTASVPASERRYAWSFIGEAGKCSRPEAVRALLPIEPHICYSGSSARGVTFFSRSSQGQKRIPEADFVEYLNQSAFAPSPMGNGSLESCRVYDALEAGSIPIIEKRISLNYFESLLGNHPLPTIRSWSQARRLVMHLLKNPAELDALQLKCTQWWKDYQAELTQKIGAFLSERSNATDEVVPLRSRLPLIPGWQYFELLRHQTLLGLARRVTRNCARLVKSGQWRDSYTK